MIFLHIFWLSNWAKKCYNLLERELILMLLSLALIFLIGLSLGGILARFKLPPLLGMLITGMILGPYALNLLDESLLNISAELRKIALVIILTRAGLNLNLSDLKKVGRPAVLMCFVPACFEILGMVIFAPLLLGISVIEAALLGSVVAAVSPAVIVPKMLRLMDEGWGKSHAIPQLIMAGASVDDVFVIVLFTSFTTLAAGDDFSPVSLLRIPISIILGILGGVISGILLGKFFEKIHLRDSVKVLAFLSLAFVLCAIEDSLTGILGFSGLIAIMTIGITLQKSNPAAVPGLSAKYSKLWVGAEVLLFALVGATVDIQYALGFGLAALILLVCGLVFRMMGVQVSMLGSQLTLRERGFASVAYCPKATVQAAIGAIPLSMGLPCGQLILAVAVLAILITAPVGAFAIDWLTPRCLERK